MREIVDFLNFITIAILVTVIVYRALVFCIGEFGFTDNTHVNTRIQQLSFFYKLFTKPIVAVLTVLAVTLLNGIAYFVE